MKILKLKLRGAIGILKGLGKEEIEIDFTNFGPGLIALTGKNGAGKTTVMENLHPYRTMVSRSGALQSHFYLKDSFRILEFEHEGKIYESKILIDALTGGSEAYLICNGTPLNDGKLTTYDEAIESVLGSQELFFNSVFSGQKSKGIAELKPADRRKLFYELLNLTVYEQYLEKAKSEIKAKEIELAEIEGQINAIDISEETKTELENARVKALNGIADTELEITKIEENIEQINSSIRDAEIEIAKLEEKQKANDEINTRLKQLNKKSDELVEEYKRKKAKLNSNLEDIEKLISRNQKLLQNKDKIDIAIAERKKMDDERVEITAKINDFKEERSTLWEKYHDDLSVFSEEENKLRELEKKRDKLSDTVNALTKEITKITSEIEIIDKVPCDENTGNSCQFLKNAYSSREILQLKIDERDYLELDLSNIIKEVLELSRALGTEKQTIKENFDLKNNELEENIRINENKVEKLEEEIEELEQKGAWEALKEEATEAETNVKILTEKMENIQTLNHDLYMNHKDKLNQLADEAEELSAKIDLDVVDKIIEAKEILGKENEQLEIKKSALTDKKTFLDYQKSVLSDAEAQLEQFAKNEEKITKLQESKTTIQNEIKDWTFLTKAFDKTGIPVLKLENSGIEITTIANELLSLFENQFRIVFETTSLTKDKKKMKETFNINIVEDDGVTEISNKSGGQQVWLETAIQSAISLVVRKQGRNIQTSFLDEKDGALDLENAHSYIEMIRKSHQLSGVHNTFIITHRPELLDFIPQQIKLADGLLTILN